MGQTQTQKNAIDHLKDVISEIEYLKAANANSIRTRVQEFLKINCLEMVLH